MKKQKRAGEREAVIEACNVLGAAVDCPECTCSGCRYERNEALGILYQVLGVKLNYKKPLKSYRKFEKLRNKEWHIKSRGKRI